jgi:hypothetical protein
VPLTFGLAGLGEAPAVAPPVPADEPTEPRTGPALVAPALLLLATIGTAAGAVAVRRR